MASSLAMEAGNITEKEDAGAQKPSDSGELRLKELGYDQDLNRSLGWNELVLMTWVNANCFSSIVPLFSFTFLNGGPVAVVWFWWIGFVLAVTMNACLAEILSSLPTAGSMYFWAAFLAPPKYSRVLAYSTAWLELLAAAFGSASSAVGAGNFLQVIIYAWSGYFITNAQIFAISIVILVSNCVLLCVPVKVTARVFVALSLGQLLAALALVISLPIVAPTRQPASFAFGHYEPYLDFTGVPSAGYAFVLSLFMVQGNLYGYDLAGHCSEEFVKADINAPWGLVMGPVISSISGWALLVALCFCIQGDPLALFDPTNATGGLNAVVQIVWDCFGTRFGNQAATMVFSIFFFFGFYSSAVGCLMDSNRTAYALARDHGLPFSSVLSKLTSWKTPVYSTLFVTFITMLTTVLLLISTTAYYALIGSCAFCWFASYGTVILLRILTPEEEFEAGPFYLPNFFGKTLGKAAHYIGLLYCIYTAVVFLFPTAFPLTKQNMNWASVASASLIFVGAIWWLVGGQFYFKGPPIMRKQMLAEN